MWMISHKLYQIYTTSKIKTVLFLNNLVLDETH